MNGTASPMWVSVDPGTVMVGNTQITLGKWYHIVMVFDGTQTTNNLQLQFADGSP